ncbi:MAG: hypothetical protein Kow0031_05510 [Anaerolineae bacterium]
MDHKESIEVKKLGRRELLKALAATGGAITAATVLPGEWSKPVVEAGVLPAHAQSSLFTLNARITNSGGAVTVTGGPSFDLLEVEVQVSPATAGIEIADEFTSGPFAGTAESSTATDASGIATFTYRLCNNYSSGPIPPGEPLPAGVDDQGEQQCEEDFEITYTFANQSQYGTASASVSGTFDTCSCQD